jgi:hypothetical protein
VHACKVQPQQSLGRGARKIVVTDIHRFRPPAAIRPLSSWRYDFPRPSGAASGASNTLESNVGKGSASKSKPSRSHRVDPDVPDFCRSPSLAVADDADQVSENHQARIHPIASRCRSAVPAFLTCALPFHPLERSTIGLPQSAIRGPRDVTFLVDGTDAYCHGTRRLEHVPQTIAKAMGGPGNDFIEHNRNIARAQNQHIRNHAKWIFLPLTWYADRSAPSTSELLARPRPPSGIESSCCGLMIALLSSVTFALIKYLGPPFRRQARRYLSFPADAAGAPPYQILHHGRLVRASVSCVL